MMIAKKKIFWGLLLIASCLVGCRLQNDHNQAQKTLTDYLTLLNEGKYAEAADLYGGTYDTLVAWNPTVDPNNYPTLLEMGCKINGLHCLPIKGVGAIKDSAPDVFAFTVQFENPDGSLFVLEALDASPSKSAFKFTVVRKEDGFVVQELPVYVP